MLVCLHAYVSLHTHASTHTQTYIYTCLYVKDRIEMEGFMNVDFLCGCLICGHIYCGGAMRNMITVGSFSVKKVTVHT